MALTVTRLIGVYDADGSLVGELRYALRKVTGRGHCSLCDLTHRGVRARADWGDFKSRIGLSPPRTTVPWWLAGKNPAP